MKNLIKISLAFCLLIHTAVVQSQNPIWTLPANYLDNQSGLTPLPTSLTINNNYPNYNGSTSNYVHNSMVDLDGNLLFFIVDGGVFDKEGKSMGYTAYDYYDSKIVRGTAEICIIPDPNNCERFFIIQGNHNDNFVNQAPYLSAMPYYSILDLNINNNFDSNKGGLVNLDINTPGRFALPLPQYTTLGSNFRRSNLHFAATPVRDDGTRFLFVQNGELILRYIISNGNISLHSSNDGGIINLGNLFGFSFNNSFTPRSELELIEVGLGLNKKYRVALQYEASPLGSNASPGLLIIEFNYNGTLIANSAKMHNVAFSSSINGIEFSNNGRFIYFTHSIGNAIKCVDYNLPSNNNAVSLPNINMSEASNFRNSQIEIGKDGNLYLIGVNSNGQRSLGRISNPNNPASLTWNNNVISGFTYPISNMGQLGSTFNRFILPDQIDGENYLNIFQTQQCCLNWNDRFTINNLYTATNGSWTNTTNPFGLVTPGILDIYVNDNFIVPSNVNLTLTNIRLHFAPDKKLIIENYTGTNSLLSGGRLTLNNSTLTVDNRCGTNQMWEGVEVWGVSNATQSTFFNTTRQGRLVLNNNAIIEHAKIGVYLGRRNQSSQFVSGTGGGIITSTGTNLSVGPLFRFNGSSVVFNPYGGTTGNSNNISRFVRTRFMDNTQILQPSNQSLFYVSISENRGIFFEGCRFINNFVPQI